MFVVKKYAKLFFAFILICILSTIIISSAENTSVSLASPYLRVNASNLKQMTEEIVNYGPRITYSKSVSATKIDKKRVLATDQSVEYIKSMMETYGLNTSLEEIRDEPVITNNVVGIKQGNDLEKQLIIVCSHYDTATTSPGADDTALGVAATLEIARILQDYELDRTVYFIAFPEHSWPMGSERWIEMHPELKNNVTAVIGIDQIGYGNKSQVTYIQQTSWLADFVQKSAFDTNNTIGGHLGMIGVSDHIPFIQNNIPAVEIIESEITPFHHKPGDTVETLNFSLAEKTTEIVVEAVYQLATPEDIDPPMVEITSPRDQVIYGDNIIPLVYNVSDNGSHIQVLLEGQNIGEIVSGTTLIFEGGKHDVEVRATDGYGNKGIAITSVKVEKYPEVVYSRSGKNNSDMDTYLIYGGVLSLLIIVACLWAYNKKLKK
ncbi:M28 family metallopeptidase [uncultured Methanolobus sp.]|uniref:M28 family metallopeptidase n=1 Tax=uncultured Methanolobus sp. TaxID=218300 RepID=UPI002AAAEF45|nr:M28 family metallopeptidase [uncultured Methanolobus sp.]